MLFDRRPKPKPPRERAERLTSPPRSWAAPLDAPSVPTAAPQPISAPTPQPAADAAPTPSDDDLETTHHTQWLEPDTATSVAGTSIPGGMIYVGRGLTARSNAVEPALIDPTLAVDHRRPDLVGSSMDYWPAYDSITPQARAAYLHWLAGGRRDPDAYIGYVFLFFYGLERRVLVDIARDPRLADELPGLRAEVQRLLRLYRDNRSFNGYATRFLDVLDLQIAGNTPDGVATPPPLEWESKWQPPTGLRVELGVFAAYGAPLPADWALAWAWYHPEVHLRTAATRCTDEFAALFKVRYSAAHGPGIVVGRDEAALTMDYRTASSGIGRATLQTRLPDVFTQAEAGRKLIALATGVMNDLDPLSRYLARNPGGRGTIGAAALLPAELVTEPSGEVKDLHEWASRWAESGQPTSGADLLSRWPTASADGMAKSEAVALAQLLEHFGLGVEPDVRLGGAAITRSTPVVVFRTGPHPPRAATTVYTAATTLLHLAVAVSAADGHVSEHEHDYLVAHLESSLDLTAGERVRLEAHARWLAATEIKLTGLKRRITALSMGERESVADLVVTVAAADGVISPDEITSLTKIFELLDLDPSDVHSRLHGHLAGGQPAHAVDPVTVRPDDTPASGYPISEPATQPTSDEAALVGVTLDLASIEAKFAETAEVSAMLTDIFSDDAQPRTSVGGAVTPEPMADQPAPAATTGPTLAGLDDGHSALLRVLAERDEWTRAEFEALADQWYLMPDGALDTLNEASLDATDEPFLDDNDTDILTVNDFARQELVS